MKNMRAFLFLLFISLFALLKAEISDADTHAQNFPLKSPVEILEMGSIQE